jgi:type IV pilus assembly protein PilA
MIVVAIVGVLAALAIYGVRKYIANAKTAEARTSVGRMAKDAKNAYAREGMAATVLAAGASAAASNRLCGATTASVPAAKGDIEGKKYQSAATDWNQGDQFNGWRCLRFSMTDPQYYMYSYAQTGAVDAAGGTFSAVAEGDLNGDGVLSNFALGGEIKGGTGTGNLEVFIAPNMSETLPEE